jgi:hypothetical protein
MRACKHWIQSATAKIIWNVKVKLYITYYRYFSIKMKFLTSIWLRRCWLTVLFEYEVAESPIKITVITKRESLHIIMNHELWGETSINFSQYRKLCTWHTHTHTHTRTHTHTLLENLPIDIFIQYAVMHNTNFKVTTFSLLEHINETSFFHMFLHIGLMMVKTSTFTVCDVYGSTLNKCIYWSQHNGDV